MGNWPTSATTFAQILERKDLNADDKIEAMGRRGFAQFQLKDLDTAERTFQSAIYFFNSIASEERLDTDFYLGLVRYHLGEIPHERFRAIPLRLPEKQMGIDMEDKARLLLAAQRQYIETIKLGNPQWAAASGYQIGSLYEEFYDAFIHAPDPGPAPGRGEPGEARGLLRGAAQAHPHPAREVAAHPRAEPADAGAAGRAERVAGQVEARLRQAAEAARPDLQVRVRRPGDGWERDAGAPAAPGADPAGWARRHARAGRAGAVDPRPQGPDPGGDRARRARFSSKIASDTAGRRPTDAAG